VFVYALYFPITELNRQTKLIHAVDNLKVVYVYWFWVWTTVTCCSNVCFDLF